LNLLSSGFIDEELQYILEFPFKAVYERLKKQLPKNEQLELTPEWLRLIIVITLTIQISKLFI
jgi:hypothetical protein